MFLSRKLNQFVFMLALPVCTQSALAAGVTSVKWKEENGQIALNSVCYNHKYGSIKYRHCRADAQKQFKGRCAHFTRKRDYATGTQRVEYQKGEKKYCYAARHLRVVN